MTASAPIIDKRQKRNQPDWLVYIRKGCRVNVERFFTEADAQAFADHVNTQPTHRR